MIPRFRIGDDNAANAADVASRRFGDFYVVAFEKVAHKRLLLGGPFFCLEDVMASRLRAYIMVWCWQIDRQHDALSRRLGHTGPGDINWVEW